MLVFLRELACLRGGGGAGAFVCGAVEDLGAEVLLGAVLIFFTPPRLVLTRDKAPETSD